MAESTHFNTALARDEIRLLVLQAADRDAPVIGHFEIVSLSSNPDFETLTHAWSDHESFKEIVVDDRPMHVEAPVAAALQRTRPTLRTGSGQVRVWTDAVCVHQRNPQERAHHMRLLSWIHAEARHAYVWIDEAAALQLSAPKLSVDHKHPVSIHPLPRNNRSRSRSRSRSPNPAVPISLPLVPSRSLKNIPETPLEPQPARLAWIQPALASKRPVFLHGAGSHDELSWEALLRIAKPSSKERAAEARLFLAASEFEAARRLREANSHLHHRLHHRHSHHQELNIYDLLYTFRALSCDDPRDRIFGLLSLLGPSSSDDHQRQYEPSLSSAHVYAEFAQTLIQRRGTLDILNCVREWREEADLVDAMADGLDYLPTWVPNWAGWTERDPEPLVDFRGGAQRYRAGKLLPVAMGGNGKRNSTASNGRRTSPGMLVLGGIRFDEIEEVGMAWHPESDSPPPSTRKGVAALEQWEEIALRDRLVCPYGGDKGRRDALWRTYIADYADHNTDDAEDNETTSARAPEAHAAYLERWYGRPHQHRRHRRPYRRHLHPGQPTRSSTMSTNTSTSTGASTSTTSSTSQPPPTPPTSSHNPLLQTLRLLRTSLLLHHPPTRSLKHTPAYRTYTHRILTACAHRRLLVTKRGYIGLAPWNARRGDVVALLYGGQTPYLLRPVPMGGGNGNGGAYRPGEYTMVGEVFVFGVMGGEGMGWEGAVGAAREFRIF
ncbi:hypothetical protein B0J18DRAFT_106074 [Chaetomium sp. MPI-SDFR-AT-0129]|nr:hypothetical protein B0J18DRAFT_106074 [Chaetomium sp. MPI-SDFR-AT-0129]